MECDQRLLSVLAKVAKEQSYEGHQVDVKPTSGTGANYSSQGFSLLLTAPGKPSLKLFVKVSTLSEDLKSLMKFDLFKTEILFYSQILPRYRKLEEIYEFPEEERLCAPKYYGASTDYLNEILVLENLVENGFQDIDRFVCIEWEYASKCVEQLAMFHALSIAYSEKNPEEFERLTEKLVNGYPVWNLQHYVFKSVELALKACHENYKEKLKNFVQKNLNDETFNKYCKPRRRSVLVHGDFRSNNIMHKVDKNGKLQVALLDHQFMQLGNPVSDLMFYIVCGSDAAFRAGHFQQLLGHYYTALCRALNRLDVAPEKVYPKKDFDDDVKFFSPYGLLVAVTALPIFTAEASQKPDVNDFSGRDDLLKNINPHLVRRLNDAVNDFSEMGVI